MDGSDGGLVLGLESSCDETAAALVRAADGAILAETVEQSPAEIRLLDLPAMLARHGIGSIDLCFNHLPSTGDEYLEGLRDGRAVFIDG